VAETWLVPAVAGLFGLVIGSFLNVCALRWPVDESVISPRSHCPGCDAPVRWYDNIPVASWLVLRGRCRSCDAPISVQYPMVELATALMWAGVFSAYGLSGEAFRGSLFLTILFGISISDARFYIIPDQFSIGGAALGVLLSFLPGGPTWLQAVIGGAVGYGVLWVVGVAGTALIKRLAPGRLEDAGVDQAMGGGDVKMMMMIGTFVGAWGVALTVFLGSVLALLVFGPIAAISKRLVPLGVFLAAGGAVTYAWGQQMIEWYLTSVVGL
jgi:leader peptidase (prepilin peptidase) / N-methyltransferase